jgi:SWI/SNF-related matrix-associated actin-dependent regulator 1 of chromatin subfamily A
MPRRRPNRFSEKIKNAARPEQIYGINFITQHRRVLLADMMGSGKTMQAIGAIENLLEVYPKFKILIITPASIGPTWVLEFFKWSVYKPVLILSGDQKVDYTAANIFIVSYGLILPGRTKYIEIADVNWNFVICDESHSFRNRESLTSMYIAPIAKKAERVLLISGTPQISRPEQLFVQYDILFPDEMKFDTYAMAFCNGKQDRTGRIVARSSSNLGVLSAKLTTVMLRRNDITLKPILKRVKISFTVKKTPLYLALQTKLSQVISVGGNMDRDRLISEIVSRMYAETGNIKSNDKQILDFICNVIVKNYLASGHKTIIFAHHEQVRSRMSAALTARNIKHVNIDGTVKPVERLKLVTEVSRMDSDVIAAVCSITATSVGYNFVPGPTIAIFLEYTWNISDTLQAEARIARYGANVPVVYAYYIHCGALYDRRLLINLKEKYLVNGQSIDGNNIKRGTGGTGESDEGQFVIDKEMIYKPELNSYVEDKGDLELKDLVNLQKELDILGANLNAKELDSVKIDLDKIVDEYER